MRNNDSSSDTRDFNSAFSFSRAANDSLANTNFCLSSEAVALPETLRSVTTLLLLPETTNLLSDALRLAFSLAKDAAD